jgi:hypothetical protein
VTGYRGDCSGEREVTQRCRRGEGRGEAEETMVTKYLLRFVNVCPSHLPFFGTRSEMECQGLFHVSILDHTCPVLRWYYVVATGSILERYDYYMQRLSYLMFSVHVQID